ncbi:MAG: hypothetical protein ACL93V_06825 [Candidatus Electrothrix sp. YB6]
MSMIFRPPGLIIEKVTEKISASAVSVKSPSFAGGLLTRAQDVLKAVPVTMAAALPVGDLLGKALIWCGKMAGM